MSHASQMRFVMKVKNQFPAYFTNTKVLDVSSLDMNGTIRPLFTNCDYLGVDIRAGKNVDLVIAGHLLDRPDGYFNVSASCECFEHDSTWSKTFYNMVRMTNGLVFFTCASTGRPEHCLGVSPTQYYKNLTKTDFQNIFNFDGLFSSYEFSENTEVHDLYFWGITKKSEAV